MSGNGWDLPSRNMNWLENPSEWPNHSTYIACRACNKVFIGAQALLSHYESHIMGYETLSRGYQPQQASRNHPPRPLSPPPSLALTLATISYTQQVAPAVTRNCRLVPQLMPSAQQADCEYTSETPRDCTKPYVMRLDNPIREVVDVDESDDDNNSNESNSNKMDLTLKL